MRFLIVDDNLSDRLLLHELLSPYAEIHVAENGIEALDSLKESIKEGQPYELITLDIVMPQMDGQAALKAIRKLEQNCGLDASKCPKILMTSSKADSSNVLMAMEHCDGYLVKPLNRQRLMDYLIKFGLATSA